MAMIQAQEKLQTLDRSAIAELKLLKAPPDAVVKVMTCLGPLFGQKADWTSFIKLIRGSADQFKKSLINYDKDNMNPQLVDKLC